MTRALCAAVVAAVVASGCSPIMVRRAPNEPEPALWPRCTEHRLYPIVDTTYAVLSAAVSVEALRDDDQLAGLALLFTVPALVGFGASAIYGWTQTSKCQRARAAYEAAALQGR